MSKFKAFYNQNDIEEVKEVTITDRFKDDNGNIQKFKVRSIPQKRNEELGDACKTKKRGKNGVINETFDRVRYQNLLIVECTLEPDFRDEGLLASYKVVDPIELPSKMLRPGEYTKLVRELENINGFKDSDDLMEEAKN